MRITGALTKVGFVFVAGFVCSASGAAYAAGKGRVGVRFSGSEAGPTRDAIVQVLERHDFSVINDERLESTAAKMHRGLETQGDLAAVAAKLNLLAVVAGEVKDGGFKAGAVVRNGSTGRVTARALWSASGPKELAEAVRSSAWVRLGAGLRDSGGGATGGQSAAAYEKLVAAAERDSDDDDDRNDHGAGNARQAPPAARKAIAGAPPAGKPEPNELSELSDAELEEMAGIVPRSEPRKAGQTEAKGTPAPATTQF